MVLAVSAFRASDGSLHPTWDEAACNDAAHYVLALLPGLDPTLAQEARVQIATEIARDVFITKDEASTRAIVGLISLFQSMPKSVADPVTHEMAARFQMPEDEEEERGWFGRRVINGGKK